MNRKPIFLAKLHAVNSRGKIRQLQLIAYLSLLLNGIFLIVFIFMLIVTWGA